jgi:group I intron endonuclease
MKLLTAKKDLNNKSGVYLIECNNHKYIGSSKNLYIRYKKHCNDLKKGSHHNDFLQKVYNKYPDLMTFKLVEVCTNYIEKETFYINYYDTDINIERNPTTREKSIATKIKLSIANQNKRLGSSNSAAVKVYQYSLEGDYIRSYDTLKEASIAINGNATSIGDAAKGDYKSSGGYQWKKQKFNKIPPITKANRAPRSIQNIIIIDGTKQIKLGSIKEAAIYLNANEGTVRKAIAKGFKCKKKVIKLEL